MHNPTAGLSSTFFLAFSTKPDLAIPAIVVHRLFSAVTFDPIIKRQAMSESRFLNRATQRLVVKGINTS